MSAIIQIVGNNLPTLVGLGIVYYFLHEQVAVVRERLIAIETTVSDYITKK